MADIDTSAAVQEDVDMSQIQTDQTVHGTQQSDPRLQNQSTGNPQSEEGKARFKPFVKTNLMLLDPDEDSRGRPFIWAKGIEPNNEYFEADGTPVVGSPGNFLIYGIPAELYEEQGSPRGKVLNGVLLQSRAIEGLFDYVPEGSHKGILKAIGKTWEEVPAPDYVLQQIGNQGKSRQDARKQSQAAKLLLLAESGPKGELLAALKAEVGTGVLEGGSQEAKLVQGILHQRQQEKLANTAAAAGGSKAEMLKQLLS